MYPTTFLANCLCKIFEPRYIRSPKRNGKKFETAGFRNNLGSAKFVIKYSTVVRNTLTN